MTETNRKKIGVFLIALCITGNMKAQLCSGSLGDPIVNIDFGAGTGRGAALGSAVTAFTYRSSGELDEGEYTIANTTAGLKGGAWHVTTDHTGNTNGYMMVVNSAVLTSEGVFYKKTVTGLCASTTYEFSAWLMNIMNPNAGTDQYHPNVTFIISNATGTVLGTYSTGEIPQTSSPKWVQYGLFFTTSTETEVVITMINSAASARPGNDIALDDIKFRPCGPSVTASHSTGETKKETCVDKVKGLTVSAIVSSGYAAPLYQWQQSTDNGTTWTDIAGANTLSLVLQQATAGTLQLRLAAANGANISSVNCRIVSNVITLQVDDLPGVDAVAAHADCFKDTLVLSASVSAGGNSFSWTGPAGFTSTEAAPAIVLKDASTNGWYYVTVTTSAGCVNSDSVQVKAGANPVANAGADKKVCQGKSVTLTGSGTGSSYSWSPAASLSNAAVANPVASPDSTTNYILTVSNSNCSAKDTVLVTVLQTPVANAGPDKYMLENSSVQLSASAGGEDITYSWTPAYNISSASVLNPVVRPASDTTYTLTVSSTNGCGIASDQVKVFVYKSISIPNAFSPNGDGINDTWSIKQLSSYENASVQVFNRYGQKVFESHGYATEWDGRFKGSPLPVGTYYYIIDLKTAIRLQYSGWVMLIK